ncbi:SMP-30/gluconolactonase/LRE family protein [Acidobacteria bacterium AH-259-L09]|nr:SMP-30/gluconolactonase/LRE family protein [Acidobacteria bacterium AH-259-L09]
MKGVCFVLGLVYTLVVCCSPAPTESPQMAAPENLLMSPLESSAELQIAVSVAFTEGPAADAEGNVYFSEIRGTRIIKWSPDGSWSEFRRPSHRANGLAFDAEGRLIACEGNGRDGGRRITRMDLSTGKVEVLAERYQGKRLNSPNDLVIERQGGIYFSDPRYGSQAGRELETEDVYRIDPDGSLTRVATKPDIHKPNGLIISPDGKMLYVADTKSEPMREARLMAFDIQEDGSLSNGRSIYSFGSGRGIDGMAIDVEGNIYGAAGNNNNPPENHAGIYIISPAGELLKRIPIPEDTVTNCTLGGPDLKTLYVTAGKNLYQIRVKNRGHLLYPSSN